MALNFPSPATEGQTYAAEGASYIYKSGRWVLVGQSETLTTMTIGDSVAGWRVIGDTLLCWGTSIIPANSNPFTIVFPRAFKAVPKFSGAVVRSAMSNASYIVTEILTGPTVSQVQGFVRDPATNAIATIDRTVDWFAIGVATDADKQPTQLVGADAGLFVMKSGDTMTGNLLIENTGPSLRWHETDAPAGEGYWQMNAFGSGGILGIYRVTTPDFSTGNTFIRFYAPSGGEQERIAIDVPISTTVTLRNTAPQLRFDDSDSVSPAGLYRVYTNADSFYFQRALAADFASVKTVWRYNGVSDQFILDAPLIGLSGAFSGEVSGTLKHAIDAGYMLVGSYAVGTYGNGYMRAYVDYNNKRLVLGSVNSAGGAAAGDFGIQTTGWSIQADGTLRTDGSAALAQITGLASIGLSTASRLDFRRTNGASYIANPSGQSLRVINATDATIWATISSTAGWAAGTSDPRLKENIEPISYGLDTIMSLRPVQFDWIETGAHDIGFIAPEVEHVIPEIVEIWEADPDIEGQLDTYAMRKDALVAVLVKAVQEQQAMIAVLNDRLHVMETRL